MALQWKWDADMSVEEFFELRENDPDHRYEYIDGDVYMMTGGTRRHAHLANTIGQILANLLQKRPCLVFNSDACVQLSETRYVCPDAAVSCDPRDNDSEEAMEEEDTFVRYPCLVVEVLSPGTRARDRGTKVKLYQECPTIQDYLIIDTEEPRVWHYQRQASDLWAIHMLGLDDSVMLTSIDASFPVAELYRKTRFGLTSA